MDRKRKQYVSQWIDLLKYPKTKAVAVRCLIYMAEAAKEFRSVSERPQNSDEPVTYKNKTVHWKSTKITLSVPKCPSPITPHDPPYTERNLPDYAELLANAINALLKQPKDHSSFYDFFNLVKMGERMVADFYKPVLPTAYTYFKVSDSRKKVIHAFDKFVYNSGDFTKEMAEIILTSIASIASYFSMQLLNPIHLAVLNNDLDALIMMLSHEVYVDAVDKDGLTALMRAVKMDSHLLAKTLILFGANVKEHKNEIKKLASSHQMLTILRQSYRPKKKLKKLKRRVPRAVKRSVKVARRCWGEKTHLLSLDGGGIRGLVLTTILAEIEAVVGKDAIKNRFAFMGGSSTGAILAIALAQGKSVSECRDIYFKLKDIVFDRKSISVTYSHEVLEEFLNKELKGKDSMATLLKAKDKFVVITASDTSVKPMKTVLFKSYKMASGEIVNSTLQAKTAESNVPKETTNAQCKNEPEYSSGDDSDDEHERKKRMAEPEKCHACHRRRSVTLRTDSDDEPKEGYCDPILRKESAFDDSKDNSPTCPATAQITYAARCSSAAPTYFESPDNKHLDGGVIANNPADLLLTEFQHVNDVYADNAMKKMNLGVVLSVGTGHVKEGKASESCQAACGTKFTCSLFKFAREFGGQIGLSDGAIVEKARAFAHSMNGCFLRFSPTFETEIELDETNNVALIGMMWETKLYMRSHASAYFMKQMEFILKQ